MRLLGLLLVLANPALAEDATLRIFAAPDGAAVSIDGKLAGVAPREEKVAPGVHTVTIEQAGVSVSETVSVVGGETRTLRLQLAPLVTPPRAFPLFGTLTFVGGTVAFAAGLLLQLPAREAALKMSALFARGGGWDAPARALEAQGLAAQTWSHVFTWAGVGVMAAGIVTAFIEHGGARPPPLVVVPIAQGGVLAWGARW